MCQDTKCKECEHAKNLKGCATKHIGEARKLISKGDVEAADLELSHVEKHLKEE